MNIRLNDRQWVANEIRRSARRRGGMNGMGALMNLANDRMWIRMSWIAGYHSTYFQAQWHRMK